MKAVDLANVGGLLLAIALSALGATWAVAPEKQAQTHELMRHAAVETEVQDGVRGLRDAGGRFVPLGDYQRVVALSSVADGLLWALLEPYRIAAFSPYADQAAFGYRYAGTPHLPVNYSTENLIALRPDLILAHHLSRADQVAQLREAGLFVFDLGEMKGLQTLLPNIRTTATLLQVPERGEALAERIKRRMDAVAPSEDAEPKTAIYAGIHGDKIYGGTVGTSYHDVLTAAGLHDVAADQGYSGWPRYTSEQMLQLNPDVLVTQTDMSENLCLQPGLRGLRACGKGGRVIELQTALLLSPGIEVVEAAEALRDLIEQASPNPTP